MFFRLQKFAKPFSSLLGVNNANQCFSSTSYSGLRPPPSESIFARIQNHQSFSAVPPEPSRLIGLDKLIETCSSETYRGFDRTLQKFVSIKSIDLNDSSESLEQLKAVLVQLQAGDKATGFSPCQGVFLDKSAQKMTVISDCNFKLLSDYSQFKLENCISWKNDELLSLSLQLLHQISALENLGGFLAAPSVQPQNIFLTSKSGILKFHSLSDFHFVGEKTRLDSDPLSKIIASLVKITNPLFLDAGSQQQAYSYLEKKYPEFLESFEALGSKEKAHYQSKGHELFSEVEFDQYVQNKLQTIIQSKNSPEWKNYIVNFFSQDTKTSSESHAESLEASLRAFKNALLFRDKVPNTIIQQVEQEYRKVYELLELVDPKVLKNYDAIPENHKKSKIKLILMSLGEDFFTSLNLGGVLKGTFIFAFYFFLLLLVFGTLTAVFEYLYPETGQFGPDFQATQNQQETKNLS